MKKTTKKTSEGKAKPVQPIASKEQLAARKLLLKLKRAELAVRKSMEDSKSIFITDNVFILALYKLMEYQFIDDRMEIANKSAYVLSSVMDMLRELKAKYPQDAKYYDDSICDVDEIFCCLDEKIFYEYGYSGGLLAA